jgi:uncharacterized protein (DUF983 family)
VAAPLARPPFRQALRTGLHRRCPYCGKGRVIERWPNKILPRCALCGLSYHRESGYCIGGMILTYGFTIGVVIAVFLVSLLLPDNPNLSDNRRFTLWITFAIPVMLILMPYAYSLWLSLDFWVEPWQPKRVD